MKYRTESDTLGEVKVPIDKYYGAQTQRALENFKISDEKFPRSFIRAYGIVKKACAIANNKLGVLDKQKMDLIRGAADEVIDGKLDDHFPLVIWQSGSGTQFNMNVNEVIANRAIEKSGGKLGSKLLHPNDHVNKSQSTNDTFPTAMHVAAAELVVNKLTPSLSELKKSLSKKATDYKKVIKIGRTHLQDATPLTLGQEFSGYAAQIHHSIIALNDLLKFIYQLPIGGSAVGTGINVPTNFDKFSVEEINKITELPFTIAYNKFEGLACNDTLIRLSGILAALAGSMMKIANDIRWLGSGPRCGIGELTLPANEPGSSIMPGKVNPTQSEVVTMICCQVMGNANTVTIAGSQGNFELNVFKPVIIYNVIKSIVLLSDGADSIRTKCIDGIEPNLERIKQHLDNSLMLVTILNTKIGYDNAAKIAKNAYNKNISLKQSAVQLGFLTSKEFDEIVKPEKMVGFDAK
ncbi:MAG: class II fumarate hydratase [Planctomycetes bacterium]|nr:class II fumarate hydratase [Planctomycetota bacterium]